MAVYEHRWDPDQGPRPPSPPLQRVPGPEQTEAVNLPLHPPEGFEDQYLEPLGSFVNELHTAVRRGSGNESR